VDDRPDPPFQSRCTQFDRGAAASAALRECRRLSGDGVTYSTEPQLSTWLAHQPRQSGL